MVCIYIALCRAVFRAEFQKHSLRILSGCPRWNCSETTLTWFLVQQTSLNDFEIPTFYNFKFILYKQCLQHVVALKNIESGLGLISPCERLCFLFSIVATASFDELVSSCSHVAAFQYKMWLQWVLELSQEKIEQVADSILLPVEPLPCLQRVNSIQKGSKRTCWNALKC